MSKLRSHLPGRLRLSVPELRDSPTVARALWRGLANRPGIEHVYLCPQAGTVVIHYDPRVVDPRPWLDPPRKPAPGGPGAAVMPRVPEAAVALGRTFGQAAFRAALEQTVRYITTRTLPVRI